MTRSVSMQRAFSAALLAGLAGGAFTPAAAAEPSVGADISGTTIYLAPNSRLHYDKFLLGRIYTHTTASLQLKGNGACTTFNCPVVHNNVSVFARRSRVSTDKPTGTIVTERPLRRGDDGEDVRIMQQALIKKGYAEVKPDGSFGRETEDAVRDFQRKNGILADGEIGPETRNKLSV